MSTKKEAEVKPEQVTPDLNTLLTGLAILLVNNRVAEHRAGQVELNPRYGTVDPATAKAIERKHAELSAAEQAVRTSRQEAAAAIKRAEAAEVNLRDIRELSNFQI